jgi:formylmethanofuran dehydrogenase subunit B
VFFRIEPKIILTDNRECGKIIALMNGRGVTKRNMRLMLARQLQAMLDDPASVRTEPETLAIMDRIIKLTGGKPFRKKANKTVFG